MKGLSPAERLLKDLGVNDPKEIDLEAVAWTLGARVKYRPLDRCEACITGDMERAIITVNSRSPRRRRRFSIGHELGHWQHHRGRILVCRSDDIGRGRLFPTSVKLRYAFKTPTLRDVARRAPYMHDGSVATLEQVVALYDKGGIERPSRAEAVVPLRLSDSEKSDLVAFLRTLSSTPQAVSVPTLPR